MKVVLFLFLLACTIWLGSEYYKNQQTIDKQAAQIENLRAALAAQKKTQMQPVPNFRLSGDASKPRSLQNGKRPERRFK